MRDYGGPQQSQPKVYRVDDTLYQTEDGTARQPTGGTTFFDTLLAVARGGHNSFDECYTVDEAVFAGIYLIVRDI
jgi:hypothetical protein